MTTFVGPVTQAALESAQIKYLMVAYPDIHGLHKGRVVPLDRFDFLKTSGPAFTGGSVPGAGQTPQHPEMVARADVSTCIAMDWMKPAGFAHFMSSLEVQGIPHPYCPRGNLQRVLRQAAELGYRFNTGVELEHYIVTRDNEGAMQPWNPQGFDGAAMSGYNLNAMVPGLPYLSTMMDHLNDIGWGVYQIDHEDGPSQWEINFKYADALITCDRAMYFRFMARHVAKQTLGNDVYVTFQAKPFPKFCGSGSHIHYHLADAQSNENLFLSKTDDKLGLSELAYHFIGGIFYHAAALCAILNPSPNCYERLHPKTTPDSGNPWTPANILYSDDNRTGMIRVPEPGHCEDRAPSGACNLYLATAAYIAAGIDGIKNKRDPGPPFFGNAFDNKDALKLPLTLSEALKALVKNDVILESLGPIAVEFQKMKWIEIGKWEDRGWLKTSYFNYV